MQTSQKKFLKVSYLGETKRLKIVKDYATLLSLARQAFDAQELPKVIKFYYLDEENEIISINSQSDLNEALDIEDLSSLKLTVASTAQEARKQLERHINENAQLAESLSQSNFLAGSLSSARRFSDFHLIAGDDLARMHSRRDQGTHEIGCGGADALMMAVDIATDVNNLVSKESASTNTAHVVRMDSCVGSNPVAVNDIGCQNITKTQDAGSDCFRTMTSHVGTQNERNVKDSEVSCEIIIPEEEEAIQQEKITCFKCLGSTVNKKGLPCRRCNGSGVLFSKEISEVIKMVREEVREYCTAQFKVMFRDHLIKKQEEQRNTVFQNVTCDGCNQSPIRGVRFMCSVCADYDLCENCERTGVHSHHPLLKIRKAEHAPSKLICQYRASQNDAGFVEPKVEKVEQKMSAANAPLKAKKQEKVKYSARFIKESIPDLFEVAPGAVFAKTWTLRNDGTTAWPVDVILVQTSGDNLNGNPVVLENNVGPQGEYDFTVQMQAPDKEGRYTAYYRLTFGDNVRFGHKIWCSILVKKPAEVKPVEAKPAEAKPVEV